MTTVLDSSAILALIWQETGHEIVTEALTDAAISTVNLSEVYAKFIDRGVDTDTAGALLSALQIQVIPFDEAQSILAGKLRQDTRGQGLSLGDRACLALGSVLKGPVLTADRAWLTLKVGTEITAIR